MKIKLRELNNDIKMGIILILVSGILLFTFKINFSLLIKENVKIIIKILYLTIFAVGISTIIHFVVPFDFAEKHLKKNKLIHLFYSSLLGILTPGPVYAIYPIIITLKNKGIRTPILVSYLTGQTLMGPARAPFEIGFFGLKFYLYRILLALIMGPVAGILYIFLSKFIVDKK